uniref:Putative secreted protein n=1 Tax=Anopheles darlingi TaxID=43151 RepID=A0A2M4DD66_ANODA
MSFRVLCFIITALPPVRRSARADHKSSSGSRRGDRARPAYQTHLLLCPSVLSCRAASVSSRMITLKPRLNWSWPLIVRSSSGVHTTGDVTKRRVRPGNGGIVSCPACAN